MKSRALPLLMLLTIASSAGAQQAPNGAPLSTYLRRSYAAVFKDFTAVVEMMPEQDFGFRPAGAVNEVRTFGGIVYHVVATTSWMCAMGNGTPDPVTALGPAAIVDKTRLLALVNDTNVRCTAYLATLTDSALTEVVTSGSAPNQLQAIRGNAAVFTIAHLNEHYGNLVTYIRAKGLVPPAVPAQAGALSRVVPPKP